MFENKPDAPVTKDGKGMTPLILMDLMKESNLKSTLRLKLVIFTLKMVKMGKLVVVRMTSRRMTRATTVSLRSAADQPSLSQIQQLFVMPMGGTSSPNWVQPLPFSVVSQPCKRFQINTSKLGLGLFREC